MMNRDRLYEELYPARQDRLRIGILSSGAAVFSRIMRSFKSKHPGVHFEPKIEKSEIIYELVLCMARSNSLYEQLHLKDGMIQEEEYPLLKSGKLSVARLPMIPESWMISFRSWGFRERKTMPGGIIIQSFSPVFCIWRMCTVSSPAAVCRMISHRSACPFTLRSAG